MQETPEDRSGEDTERRSFLRRPASPTPAPSDAPDVTSDLGALQRAVDDRIRDGLRSIEFRAETLMREIAAEMWKASSGDASNEQDRIISFLSRDQAIKSLITTSDERFQALAVKTARLEDTLADLAESSRAMRDAMADGAKVIHETVNSPALHGVEVVRDQLVQVERHIAEAFQHLNDRDKALVEGIQHEINDHGDIVMRETTRVVEAMQSYVQGGVEAMGMLAQRVEAHINTVQVHDDDMAEKLRGTVQAEIHDFAEQLQLIHERVGMQGRDVESMTEGVKAQLDHAIMGLAQLVRSDSQTLHRALAEATQAREGSFRESLEDGLSGMAAQTRDALVQHSAATTERMDSVAGLVEEKIGGISDEVAAAIDHQMARLADLMEAKIASLGESIAQRAAEAADVAIASSFGDAMGRLTAATASIEDQHLGASEERAATEERMIAHLDDRMTAIARLIRSDNKVLADQLAAAGTGGGDPETAKQTLRAVKELQAVLTSDVNAGMDQRFDTMAERMHRETQSTAETMAKVAEVLAEKMDRLTVKIDDVYGNDLQVVIERIGQSMRELAAMGRERYQVD